MRADREGSAALDPRLPTEKGSAECRIFIRLYLQVRVKVVEEPERSSGKCARPTMEPDVRTLASKMGADRRSPAFRRRRHVPTVSLRSVHSFLDFCASRDFAGFVNLRTV
jgi:hypothetical protein